MKSFSVLLFSLVLSVLQLSAQQINDANAEQRDAKNFHAIHLSSAFDVYLSQGNEEAVAVSAAEKKYRDKIKVEVKEGTLYITYENEGLKWSSGNKKLKAYISFKQLDKLMVSGACDVFTSGSIKSDNLEIHLSGASDLKTILDVERLKVDMSGASDMTVSGTANRIEIDASGACDFKGFDLHTTNCSAKAAGASDIKITVNGELSAHATGASDVKYRGDAVIKEIHNSGSSSVSKG
jgi:hypothetical protein